MNPVLRLTDPGVLARIKEFDEQLITQLEG
jgi:hypothetical protein